MNLLGKQPSYRRISRLPDLKSNLQKRVFGRDITNLERKGKKNTSIYDKIPTSKVETKPRSYSAYNRKDALLNRKEKDALHEYRQDIMDFMVDLQKAQAKQNQKEITSKMRHILIDWLIDVHNSFELKEQTLHLALSYLSDYSSLRHIEKEQYQLVGITCLWIASKYQEIYPPKTKNYIEVTAGTYSLKELKNMESKIIQALQFDLNRTTTLQILQSSEKDLPDKNISLCKFLLELCLMEGSSKNYAPLTIVSAAMLLADTLYKTKTELKIKPTQQVCGQQLKLCYKQIATLLQGNNKYDLKAVRRKYAKSKYHCVGKKTLSINQ